MQTLATAIGAGDGLTATAEQAYVTAQAGALPGQAGHAFLLGNGDGLNLGEKTGELLS